MMRADDIMSRRRPGVSVAVPWRVFSYRGRRQRAANRPG